MFGLIYRNKIKSECHKRKEIYSPCELFINFKIMSSYNNTFIQIVDPDSCLHLTVYVVQNRIKVEYHYHQVLRISRVTSDHKFLKRPAQRLSLHHWANRLPVHTKPQLVVIATRCNWSQSISSSVIVLFHRSLPSIVQIPTSISCASYFVVFK